MLVLVVPDDCGDTEHLLVALILLEVVLTQNHFDHVLPEHRKTQRRKESLCTRHQTTFFFLSIQLSYSNARGNFMDLGLGVGAKRITL